MNRNLTACTALAMMLICTGGFAQEASDPGPGVTIKDFIPDTIAARIAADAKAQPTTTTPKTAAPASQAKESKPAVTPNVYTEDLDKKPAGKKSEAKPQVAKNDASKSTTARASEPAKEPASPVVSANPMKAKNIDKEPDEAVRKAVTKAKETAKAQTVVSSAKAKTSQDRIVISESDNRQPPRAEAPVNVNRSEFPRTSRASTSKSSDGDSISFEGRIVAVLHRPDGSIRMTVDDGDGIVQATVPPVIGMRVPSNGAEVRVHGRIIGDEVLEVDRIERLGAPQEPRQYATPDSRPYAAPVAPPYQPGPIYMPAPPPPPVFW